MRKPAVVKPVLVRGGAKAKVDDSLMPPDEFSIVMPYPPSANAYWIPVKRGNGATIVVTHEATKYKKLAKEALDSQWLFHPHPRAAELEVICEVFPPNLRGDVHNAPKVLLDSLQGIVLVDDVSITCLTVRRAAVDKINPRVEIKIERVK